MTDDAKEGVREADELTEDEKYRNVVELAFSGDERRYQRFCDVLSRELPEGTRVVLRGSCVTGQRWRDGAPFDADGPGTSDLDLTLVGDDILSFYILDGFYVPGLHSKPLSDKDPDIAPDLVPLRHALQNMVNRPVNIQGTRDLVMYLRGDLFGQPYLTMIEKVERRLC
jgi:hypothetical protein